MYGKYLTTDEITDIVAPPKATISKLVAFVRAHGGQTRLSRNRDMIHITATLAQLANMFDVKFEVFTRGRQASVSFVGSVGPYSLAAGLAEHVAFVSNLVELPDVPRRRASVDLPPTNMQITPNIIRARYNITSNGCTNKNSSTAVAEFQAQYFLQSDLNEYFKNYVTTGTNTTVNRVIGPNKQNPGVESSLDIQVMMGVATNCPTSFYSMASNAFWSDLTTWTALLESEDEIPWVMSVSYGSQGSYPSASYISALDSQFMRIGLRGTSVIFASGDSGAGCGGSCLVLQPSYPSMSPYVTAVGSTEFISQNSGPEAATAQFGSGGGFGQPGKGFVSAPAYSAPHYSGYLKSGVSLPNAKAYDASNRANPDVAALGSEEFMIIVGGRTEAVGGTSCAAPTFGAMIAMLNDHQLNSGQPTLGFLNQLIYTNWAETHGVFFDVVVGNNICQSSDVGAGNQCGWDTTVGWDPVSGMGTLNFAEAIKNLPTPRK
eukprot:c11273_g1_i1.p2 GENE.c11273_g1_i1~~c11273_g1_i1.p2  ORF type:complete len:575 (+),score=128.28 c11273_g1_i1:261-1727(+)